MRSRTAFVCVTILTKPKKRSMKSSFYLYLELEICCIGKADELPVHNRKGVGNQTNK